MAPQFAAQGGTLPTLPDGMPQDHFKQIAVKADGSGICFLRVLAVALAPARGLASCSVWGGSAHVRWELGPASARASLHITAQGAQCHFGTNAFRRPPIPARGRCCAGICFLRAFAVAFAPARGLASCSVWGGSAHVPCELGPASARASLHTTAVGDNKNIEKT